MNNTQDTNQISLVSRCDATSCSYNENHECNAGQIEVAMSGQMAQCLTYSPEEGDSQGEQPTQSMH